jgi:hypothetical protein
MDSDGEDAFIVFAEGGKQLKFAKRNGLYVLCRDKVENNTEYSFLTVVLEILVSISRRKQSEFRSR